MTFSLNNAFILPVYDGVIGPDFSYEGSGSTLQSMSSSGIKQLLDMRYDAPADKLRRRCAEFSIHYYHYPVHNDPATIASMCEHLLELSDLIRSGSFYMMGRTVSKIALCALWTFHDSRAFALGRGELEADIKHDEWVMKRVMPILHGMLNYEKSKLDNPKPSDIAWFQAKSAVLSAFPNVSGPETFSYSIIDFHRKQRNGGTVYEVSIEGMGVMGYLYSPETLWSSWSYNLLLPPYPSAEAHTLDEAVHRIVRFIVHKAPNSIHYAKLPDAKKQIIAMLSHDFGF